MLIPIVKSGVMETGPVQVWVWSRTLLGANNAPYGVAGIKTDNLFVAGIVTLSIVYAITGAGSTTIKAIPMDEDDNLELPFSVTLGTGIAVGSGFLTIPVSLVCSSLKFQLISTSTNNITAAVFGRTA